LNWLLLDWEINRQRFDGMEELIFDLESLPCPWGVLLALDEVVKLRNLIVVFDIVIAVLEVMEFIDILVGVLALLLSHSRIGSSFKFTFP
jgi:hypothetical protein